MDKVDLKLLKKLADTCRKAGIKTFKGQGLEFTLTEDAPISSYKKSKASKKVDNRPLLTDEEIATDLPGGDALLFWSSDAANQEASDK